MSSPNSPTAPPSGEQLFANDWNSLRVAIRKRPAMYIGDPDERGLMRAVWELFASRIDQLAEMLDGGVWVRLLTDGSVAIDLSAPLLHPGLVAGSQLSQAEAYFTLLQHPEPGMSTPRLVRRGPGLHGVGPMATNALSEWLRVQFDFEGQEYGIDFARGEVTHPLSVLGPAQTGHLVTRIQFFPDPTIFSQVHLNYHQMAAKLESWAFIYPGVRLVIEDHRIPQDVGGPLRSMFHYPHGIGDYLLKSEAASATEHHSWQRLSPILGGATSDSVMIELGYRYDNSGDCRIESFVNGLATDQGGAHEEGLIDGLTRASRELSAGNGHAGLRNGVQYGLNAVVSVHLPGPRFEGPSRLKLIDHDGVRSLTAQAAYEAAMKSSPWT